MQQALTVHGNSQPLRQRETRAVQFSEKETEIGRESL